MAGRLRRRLPRRDHRRKLDYRRGRGRHALDSPNSVAVGNPARVIKALDPCVPRAIEAASVGVISRGETGERA